MGFSPFTPPPAPFKSGAASGAVAARTQRPKPSGRESSLQRCWTNGTQFTRNLQRNFPDADLSVLMSPVPTWITSGLPTNRGYRVAARFACLEVIENRRKRVGSKPASKQQIKNLTENGQQSKSAQAYERPLPDSSVILRQ